MGISLVAVDTTGHVRWVRNLRRNDIMDDDNMVTLGVAMLDGKVCVAKKEGAKYPAIYDISSDAKKFKAGDKGNLVVYTVDADGTTEKLLLEKKSKHTVFRTLTRPDDTLLIVGSNGKKTRLLELRYQ